MYSFLLMEIIFLLPFTQNNECMNVFIPSHGNNILADFHTEKQINECIHSHITNSISITSRRYF